MVVEHHLLSRPLKTPPCSRETLWISHSVMHSLHIPCPQQTGACQPEGHLLKQLYLVSGCSSVPAAFTSITKPISIDISTQICINYSMHPSTHHSPSRLALGCSQGEAMSCLTPRRCTRCRAGTQSPSNQPPAVRNCQPLSRGEDTSVWAQWEQRSSLSLAGPAF